MAGGEIWPLIELAPKGLAHVFYSDSGSTAVEVALKMALGYWRNACSSDGSANGKPRTRIVALEHAYHGDTVGTIRRCGFSMLSRAAFELEPDDLRPPQVIDWDSADPYLLARFIDELTD